MSESLENTQSLQLVQNAMTGESHWVNIISIVITVLAVHRFLNTNQYIGCYTESPVGSCTFDQSIHCVPLS